MNCARVRQMLDAFVDHELDSATNDEIEAHLRGCRECASARAERVGMLERLRVEAPYYAAPPALRTAVDRALDQADRSPPRMPARPTWLQTGLLAAGGAVAGLLFGLFLNHWSLSDATPDQAVASHVASLAPPRRLIDIASTDRHVVKPWLSGKIDFAPPVLDLDPHGFALLGARLDHIGDHQAAAVVYRIRNHDINLFVWRAAREGTRTETTLSTVRGFGVASWTQDGLRFAAVSDVDQRDLLRFANLLRQEPG